MFILSLIGGKTHHVRNTTAFERAREKEKARNREDSARERKTLSEEEGKMKGHTLNTWLSLI